jgi:hypothetical protein
MPRERCSVALHFGVPASLPDTLWTGKGFRTLSWTADSGLIIAWLESRALEKKLCLQSLPSILKEPTLKECYREGDVIGASPFSAVRS